MFAKKSWQFFVVKFWPSVVSNAWGNGVGKTGASAGTVGTSAESPLLVELAAVVVGVALPPVGKSNDEELFWPEPEPLSGLGWRLWMAQSLADDQLASAPGEKRSRATGWDNALVVYVINMRTRGTKMRETRRVLAPIRFFSAGLRLRGISFDDTTDAGKGDGRGEIMSSSGGVSMMEGGRFSRWEREGDGERRSGTSGERDCLPLDELEASESIINEPVSTGIGLGDGGGVNMGVQWAWV
jgi:hypothetical protein